MSSRWAPSPQPLPEHVGLIFKVQATLITPPAPLARPLIMNPQLARPVRLFVVVVAETLPNVRATPHTPFMP